MTIAGVPVVDFLYYRLWWPIKHWRCTLLGHHWGADHRHHEVGVLYEAWVDCLRCDAYVETYSVYGGQTDAGKRINRPYGHST